MVREIRDGGGVNILISSHLLHDIEECCDEVIILKDGHIAAICNLEEERKANLRFLELEISQENGFVEAIGGLGCETARFSGGRLKVVMPETIEVREIYRLAGEHNVQIRRMNYRRDSLEDIFLRAMEGTQPVAVTPPPPPPMRSSANGSL
jgi:ABC-2 type transport system ATP-binding protein